MAHPPAAHGLVQQIIDKRNDAMKNHKDNVMRKRLQVVACSASFNTTLRKAMIKKNWMQEPIVLDTSGDTLSPASLHHYCLVVTPQGVSPCNHLINYKVSFDEPMPREEFKKLDIDITEKKNNYKKLKEPKRSSDLPLALPDDDVTCFY